MLKFCDGWTDRQTDQKRYAPDLSIRRHKKRAKSKIRREKLKSKIPKVTTKSSRNNKSSDSLRKRAECASNHLPDSPRAWVKVVGHMISWQPMSDVLRISSAPELQLGRGIKLKFNLNELNECRQLCV